MRAILLSLLLNSCLINADEHQSSIEGRQEKIEMRLGQLVPEFNSNMKRNIDGISNQMKRIAINVIDLKKRQQKTFKSLKWI